MSSSPASGNQRAPTLYFIIGFKLLKGLAALLIALGIYTLAGQDLQDLFDRFLLWAHLDPENRFFSAIGDQLDTVTAHNVKMVSLGTLIYGLFMLVVGIGLALRTWWAVWLAIGESAFFIPIEIYELAIHPRWELVVLLAFNVLVVWYLFRNRNTLFHHHHHH